MESFYLCIIIFVIGLAIFDLIVGVSNDAVNFLNSAVGAKAASFKWILLIASVGVFIGAAFSNGMMDVARHGIFQPQFFSFEEIMVILVAVMVTDVVLLDIFNSLGMPTSTTVSLVFELLGGTVALATIKYIATDGALTYSQMINNEKALQVIFGIFLSIAIAFVFGYLVQYITRLLFTFNYKKNLKWFGGIFGGVALTAIVYFLLIKGLKTASFMTADKVAWIQDNTAVILLGGFVGFSIIMQVLHWFKINVLKIVVLAGTFALAMAFAGNDLVNFIGVPLTTLASYQDFVANSGDVGADGYMMESLLGSAKTPVYYLIGAGALMVGALVFSKKAHNVIKTSLNLSSQKESDEMFGSSLIARRMVVITQTMATKLINATPKGLRSFVDRRFQKDDVILENGASFDLLRAAVNLVMASLLIALGTSMKLPLSTTFVTFMVAMGTSLADKAWSRESAVFRVTGVISVIGGWFITAGAAFIIAFVVGFVMYYGSIPAMIILAIAAILLIVRSHIRYTKKSRAEKRDEIWVKINESNDSAEIWDLTKSHISSNVANELDYVAEFQSSFVESFICEDRRTLRRLFTQLREEKQLYKTARRKELMALKRVDSLVAIEAGTWVHLTSNNTSQLLYSLRRLIEPCYEHVENNFNPLPESCATRLREISSRLTALITKTREMNQDTVPLVEELSIYKKEVKVAIDENYKKLHDERDSSNINIYILYQTILQETIQMADTLKHLARAITALRAIPRGAQRLCEEA